MKASDYNKKPEIQYKEPRKRFLTGDNLTTMIKSLVSLAVVYLLLTTGKWAVEFMIDHQPVIVNQAQVDSAIVRLVKPDTVQIVKPDTLTIPVEYKYVDSHFASNGDTTYWFYVSSHSRGQSSNRVAMPYSYFNFEKAAAELAKNQDKDKPYKNIFIEYFQQISKASYYSYKRYAEKY